MIPRLEAERLTLRGFRRDDFEAWASFCSDPEAMAQRLGETKGPAQELALGGREFTADIWSIAREDWQKRA